MSIDNSRLNMAPLLREQLYYQLKVICFNKNDLLVIELNEIRYQLITCHILVAFNITFNDFILEIGKIEMKDFKYNNT